MKPGYVIFAAVLIVMGASCAGKDRLCAGLPCYADAAYLLKPSVRTGGFPAAGSASDTRLCDADGKVECPLRFDTWFDVEWTGPGVATFELSEFADGRDCTAPGDLSIRLVSGDGTEFSGTVTAVPAASGDGSDAGGSRFCGKHLVKFAVLDANLLVDGFAVEVRDNGQAAAGRKHKAIRFLWSGGH